MTDRPALHRLGELTVLLRPRDGAWVVAFGIGRDSERNPEPPTGSPARNVATLCSVTQIPMSNPDPQGRRVGHRATVVVDVIDPVFAWEMRGGFSGSPNNDWTFRAQVGRTGKPPVAITFGGSNVVNIPANTTVTLTSDPVPLKLLAGDRVDVFVWTQPISGSQTAVDLTGYVPTEDIGVSDGPYSLAFDRLLPTKLGWATVRQARIVAPSDQPAWIAVGDSIAQQEYSWPERGVHQRGLAGVKSALGGEGYIYFPSRWHQRIGIHTPYATHLVDQYGINDIGDNNAENAKINALSFWKHARNNGIDYLLKGTLLPVAGTSNNWLDAAGQTPSRMPARPQFNQWLRDGAPLAADLSAPAAVGTTGAVRAAFVTPAGEVIPGSGGHPVSAISDVGGSVEEGVDSGIYNAAARAALRAVSHTDGLHPANGVHAIAGDRLARDLALLGF